MNSKIDKIYRKNEDNPSSLADCQELAILHNLQLQMLFSDIYMQILEENENEKQRANGNVAIYMYKGKKKTKQVNSRHLDWIWESLWKITGWLHLFTDLIVEK